MEHNSNSVDVETLLDQLRARGLQEDDESTQTPSPEGGMPGQHRGQSDIPQPSTRTDFTPVGLMHPPVEYEEVKAAITAAQRYDKTPLATKVQVDGEGNISVSPPGDVGIIMLIIAQERERRAQQAKERRPQGVRPSTRPQPRPRDYESYGEAGALYRETSPRGRRVGGFLAGAMLGITLAGGVSNVMEAHADTVHGGDAGAKTFLEGTPKLWVDIFSAFD